LVQHRRLRIEITPDATTYQLLEGEPLQVLHDGDPVTVATGTAVLRPTRKAPPSEPPSQPMGRTPRRRQVAP
jgi:alpha,alpha-trehalose phosphorylase